MVLCQVAVVSAAEPFVGLVAVLSVDLIAVLVEARAAVFSAVLVAVAGWLLGVASPAPAP